MPKIINKQICQLKHIACGVPIAYTLQIPELQRVSYGK